MPRGCHECDLPCVFCRCPSAQSAATCARHLPDAAGEHGFDPDLVVLAAEVDGEGLAKSLATYPWVGIVDYTGGSAFGTWLERSCPQAVVYTEKAGLNTVLIDSTDDFRGLCANLAFSITVYSGQMCTAPPTSRSRVAGRWPGCGRSSTADSERVSPGRSSAAEGCAGSVRDMLRVIGAGLPRTGTTSLRAALTTLLGGECYHMHELFERLEHVPQWQAAIEGHPDALVDVLDGYVAAVDWPASAVWPAMAEIWPDPLIVLSTRRSGEAWWRSVDATIAEGARNRQGPELEEWQQLFRALLRRTIGENWDDPQAGAAAYERHCEQVRATVPQERFLEWSADQGWEPLCRALDLPVPHEPFPHLNASDDWQRSE